MELRTVGGRLKLGGAFKLVATGYALGAGVIFVPLFAIITLATLTIGPPAKMNGQVVTGAAGVLVSLVPVIMLPLILAMQSVMIGGLVVFGLWLYQRRRPLRVVAEDAPV